MVKAPYWALFWTQFLGALNDNLFKNALVVLIAFRGLRLGGMDTPSVVAFSGGVFILPFFIFSAFSGQIADKFQKSRIAFWVKVSELGIMLLAAVGFYTQNVTVLMGVLFGMGTHSTFFGPIKYSMLPDLLPETELVKGNAYIELGTFLAILVGTLAGGFLVSLPSGPTLVSFGLILLSVMGIAASTQIPEVKEGDPGLHLKWNPVPQTWATLKMAHRDRAIFNSVLGISWFWFLGAAIMSMLPVYVKDTLNAGEHTVTLFLAVFTIGVALGSVVCERLSFKRVEIGLVPLGTLGMTFFLWNLSQADPTVGPRVVLDLLGIACCGGLFIVPLFTFIQSRSERAMLSRIIASNNIINALFMVASSVFLMALYAWKWSIPHIFLLLSVINLLVSGYIYSLVPEFTLRFVSWVLVHLLYRIEIRGHAKVPDEGPALLVCNHVSFVDWLIIAGAVRRPVRFVIYYKFAEIPLLKYLLKQAKVIPIAGAREDAVVFKSAFEAVSRELRAGQLVCIFPEGALTEDGNLNEFKPGVEFILKTDPVPVIPMALGGLWGSTFSRQKGRSLGKMLSRFRSRVSLTIHDAVQPDGVTAGGLQKEVQGILGRPR